MKKFLFLLFCLILVSGLQAQNATYLTKDDFQSEKKKLNDNLNAAKRSVADLKKLLSEQKLSFDTVKKELESARYQVSVLNDSLVRTQVRMAGLSDQVENKKTFSREMILFLFVLALAMIVVSYFLIALWRRSSDALIRSLGETMEKGKTRMEQEIAVLTDAMKTASRNLQQSLDAMENKIAQSSRDFENRFDAHQKENTAAEEALKQGLKQDFARVLKDHEEHHASFMAQADKRAAELSEKVNQFAQSVQKVKDALSGELDTLKNSLKVEFTRHTSDYHSAKKA